MQKILAVMVLLLLSCATALAQEARVVLRSTVTGNQEQPKVLYIVPWQQADMPELIYRPMQSLVEGVYEQLDRDEFLRELDYREKINAAQDTSTAIN
jgi:hypothetical protein